MSAEDNNIQGVIENRGVFEMKGKITFGLDSKGAKYVIITVTNRTAKVLWIPRVSSEKAEGFSENDIGFLGFESINWDVETGKNKSKLIHVDGGLCEFPRSYSKLLPNKSAVYLLNGKDSIKDNKNKFKVEIWAPWRLKNGQRVNENKKKEIVAKQIDTYEEALIKSLQPVTKQDVTEILAKPSILIERIVAYYK